jgi:hypothetical protein
MGNVRQWLQQQGDQQSVAAAALDDQLLHALLMGSGYCQTLRRVYIARDGPHSEAQELRQVRPLLIVVVPSTPPTMSTLQEQKCFPSTSERALNRTSRHIELHTSPLTLQGCVACPFPPSLRQAAQGVLANRPQTGMRDVNKCIRCCVPLLPCICCTGCN